MPVIEYKHHVFLGDHRRHIPGFVTNPDNWYSPINHSYVGWVKENPDYYVPWSTLKILSKEDFVQRSIQLHQVRPIMVFDNPEDEASPNNSPSSMRPANSEEEVRQAAEKWYDNFVAINSENP
jgi:hypothetical protein